MPYRPKHIDDVPPFLFPDAEKDRLARLQAAKPQVGTGPGEKDIAPLQKSPRLQPLPPDELDGKSRAAGEKKDE